jgi:shikimate kinase
VEDAMPSISAFYGIIIYLYFNDNKQHSLPHIHVRYQENEVVVAIPDGKILDGHIAISKMKILQAWIEIHKEELMANWALAMSGEQPYKIEPLR